MITITHLILLLLIKALIALAVLVYAGLVLTAYAMEGPHYKPRLQLTRPARSGERLMVWTGVRILDATVRLSKSLLNQLFTASADVGDWFVDRSSTSVKRNVRRRFL